MKVSDVAASDDLNSHDCNDLEIQIKKNLNNWLGCKMSTDNMWHNLFDKMNNHGKEV